MPTIMDDLDLVLDCVGTSRQDVYDAVKRLIDVTEAYDALAPTPEMWAGAPEWAEWYAITAGGVGVWFQNEPNIPSWMPNNWRAEGLSLAQHVHLPIGIDWRIVKFRRPAETEPTP